MTAYHYNDTAIAKFIKLQSDRLVNEVEEIATINFPEEHEAADRQSCIDYLILHAFLWYNIEDRDERGELVCLILDAFEATIV